MIIIRCDAGLIDAVSEGGTYHLSGNAAKIIAAISDATLVEREVFHDAAPAHNAENACVAHATEDYIGDGVASAVVGASERHGDGRVAFPRIVEVGGHQEVGAAETVAAVHLRGQRIHVVCGGDKIRVGFRSAAAAELRLRHSRREQGEHQEREGAFRFGFQVFVGSGCQAWVVKFGSHLF